MVPKISATIDVTTTETTLAAALVAQGFFADLASVPKPQELRLVAANGSQPNDKYIAIGPPGLTANSYRLAGNQTENIVWQEVPSVAFRGIDLDRIAVQAESGTQQLMLLGFGAA